MALLRLLLLESPTNHWCRLSRGDIDVHQVVHLNRVIAVVLVDLIAHYSRQSLADLIALALLPSAE